MKITLTESFQRDIKTLADPEREAVFTAMLKIPGCIKDIHQHQGIGLRKIHPSGIFEARVGLGLRLVFGYRNDELLFHRAGNHEEIKRYLKNL